MMKKLWRYVVIVAVLAMVGSALPMMSFAAINGNTAPAVLQGVIESMPDAGNIGVWQVSNVPVLVDASTIISDRAGAPDVGSSVKVQGFPDGNGGITAKRIKVETMMPDAQLTGVLDAFDANGVLVAGVDIARDANTLVVGALHADQYVKALFEVDQAGQRMAVQIISAEAEYTPAVVHFAGLIQTVPAGRAGDWIIAGQHVQVTASTWMNEYKGLAQVGAMAAVQGIRQANGVLLASKITVLKALNENMPNPIHAYTEFQGIVDELPAGTFLGAWQVSGRTVKVTASTYVAGAIEVGDQVLVKGYVLADGSVTADRIIALGRENGTPSDPGNGHMPTVTPTPYNPGSGWMPTATPTASNPGSGHMPTVTPTPYNPGSGWMPTATPTASNPGSGHMPTVTPTPYNPGSGWMPTATPTASNPGSGHMPTVTPTPYNPSSGQMPTATPTASNPGSGQMPTATPTASNPGSGQMPTATPTASNPGSGQMPTATPTASNPGSGQMPTATPTPHHYGPFGNG